MASTAAAASVWALDGGSDTAQDARRAFLALLQTGSDAAGTVSGIRGDTANSDGLMVSPGSGLAVAVSPGECFLASADSSQGVTVATFAAAALTLAAAGAQDRYDWVIGNDTGSAAQLQVVTGTVGAGAPPDLPALGFTRYLPLASVRVRAGAGSLQGSDVDTSMRTFTTALGGLPPNTSAGPTWKTWTPSWTGNGSTQPTIANGTIVGSYFQGDDGMLDFDIVVTLGTTTGQGNSDFYYFNLPVQPVSDWAASAYYDWGFHGTRARIDSSNSRVIVGIDGSFVDARPAAPAGAGIKLIISGRYRYQ